MQDDSKEDPRIQNSCTPLCQDPHHPPFYHAMMDVVFGFKGQVFKNACKTFKLYALLIVCLLTGATSILVLEGLETQDVVQALERHSARHGVPTIIYVDNGTNLIALQHAKYSIRDVNAHVQDSLGLTVQVTTAKSNEGRGRAEAKVKTLREMLEKLSVQPGTCMTALQWETLFCKASSQIDDIPIAKTNSSNVNDPEGDLLTGNRIKLGRDNNRSLQGPISLTKGSGMTNLLQKNQQIQAYWYQLLLDRIHHLIPRPAKWKTTDIIKEGDICLFVYKDGDIKEEWKIGKILQIINKNKVHH